MNASLQGLRSKFMALHHNKAFELTVIFIIVLSALLIGATTYDVEPFWVQVLEVLDLAITLFFLVEILIRIAAEARIRDFFKNGWNLFDFTIVTASLIPIDESQMVLLARLLRIFRVLRLVSMIPELQILVNALLKAIPRIGYVVLLMFIIFYVYAAFGSFLFEQINPVLWGDISISMLTLFRIATFEDWTDVMYETMAVYPLSWIFYLSFIVLSAFVFLNMMIGVVIDAMQKEHDKYDRDHDEGEAGEVHWIREHTASMEARLQHIERMLEQLSQDKGTDQADTKPTRPLKGSTR